MRNNNFHTTQAQVLTSNRITHLSEQTPDEYSQSIRSLYACSKLDAEEFLSQVAHSYVAKMVGLLGIEFIDNQTTLLHCIQEFLMQPAFIIDFDSKQLEIELSNPFNYFYLKSKSWIRKFLTS